MDLADLKPAQVGQLQVRGGVGGIRFQLEELLEGAQRLEVLSAELSAIETRLQGSQGSLMSYQLDTPSTGSTAVMAVRQALSEIATARTGLEKISRGVRAAHQDYELNEIATGLHRFLGHFSPLSLGPVAALPASWPPDRDATEFLAGSAPVALGLMLLALPRGQAVHALAAHAAAGRSPSDIRSVVRLVAETSGSLYRPRAVTATAGRGERIRLDPTPAGLLERARQLADEPEAVVEVIAVQKEGVPAYIVIVPGTRGGDPGGSDPFDTVGVVEGLGYASSDTSAAIREGLRAAGATEGSEVVAVGYSQGGIHAMNLARNRAFLDEFELKYVLTAGSPVGAVEAGPGISTLHLEHRQDWVPGSDGLPGPDARNRVTVTLTDPVHTPAGQNSGLGPGHALENYRNGAVELYGSADPSVVESLGVLSGVVGAGGLATATKVVLTRAPEPGRKTSPLLQQAPDHRAALMREVARSVPPTLTLAKKDP